VKRLILLLAAAASLSACIHPWVGRPASQLVKEMGRPLRIQHSGTDQIYFYRDTLAGYGEMTFTVDSKGIIRSWDATNNVAGPFGGDVVGIGGDPSGIPAGDPGGATPF
jgi:hypothetical protein